MSQSFTLRLPDDIAQWLEETANQEGIKKAQLVINILQGKMQDTCKTTVRQPQDNALLKTEQNHTSSFSPKAQDDCKTDVLQVLDTLQDKLVQLTQALEASTAQQRKWNTQFATLGITAGQPTIPTPPDPSSESTDEEPAKSEFPPNSFQTPKKTEKPKTRTGGKTASIYLYNGKRATIEEHLQTALPQLTEKERKGARDNIGRAIRGRKDGTSRVLPPEEAIEREIQRWQERLPE